jgi:hypothetical protein
VRVFVHLRPGNLDRTCPTASRVACRTPTSRVFETNCADSRPMRANLLDRSIRSARDR